MKMLDVLRISEMDKYTFTRKEDLMAIILLKIFIWLPELNSCCTREAVFIVYSFCIILPYKKIIRSHP